MAKLIFLDIDGVLDTYKSRYMLDPTLMDKLGIILGKTGACRIPLVTRIWTGSEQRAARPKKKN